MANNRRNQKTKPLTSGRNERYMEGMQELRRSNAAGPHRSKADYRRKPKHTGRGWSDD